MWKNGSQWDLVLGKIRLKFGSGQSEVRFVWSMVSFRYDSSWG